MTPASRRFRFRLILAVALVTALAGPALAQSSNGALHGTVTDQGGGVLPGVTVKLQSSATGLAREVVTNASGVYVFNFDAQLVESIGAKGGHAVLFHFREATQDLLDGTREDIHAANDQHIVGSTQHAAFQQNEAIRPILYVTWTHGEGPGLPPAILARTRGVAIPMAGGFDSLNVATTSGIVLHHLAHRRLSPLGFSAWG